MKSVPHCFSLSITNLIDFLLTNYSFCKHRRYKSFCYDVRRLDFSCCYNQLGAHRFYSDLRPELNSSSNFALSSAAIFDTTVKLQVKIIAKESVSEIILLFPVTILEIVPAI